MAEVRNHVDIIIMFYSVHFGKRTSITCTCMEGFTVWSPNGLTVLLLQEGTPVYCWYGTCRFEGPLFQTPNLHRCTVLWVL